MPERTVKVNLVAVVNGYISGMEQAARKTRDLGTAAERLAAQRQGFDVLGRAAVAVGAAAAAGVALAVKAFADFDAKMSQVQSLSHATADEMEVLAAAALHMGQAIGFSASEVADAEIELVKAGISVKDMLGGALSGALQLAAAGQIDVADATEIATIAMTQFGLKGAEIPHVADLLAAGADKALGGVGDLGEALKSGGLVAAQFGVSLDETAGTLAAFANAGLIGETAGTDLRQMLLKLAAPAADAQKVMDDLGITIYDKTSGAFVGISNLAGQLTDKMSALTPEVRNASLATLFGARAIAGANVLYKEGAEGIEQWTSEVNDSGFAAQQAAGKMDNLKGDISKLEAAFNTGLIEAGGSSNDVLRQLTQTLTGLVTGIGNLPEPVLAVALGLGAVVAVIGLVGGAALIAVPQVARFKEGLISLNVTGRSAAIGLGVAAGAVALAGAALAYFASVQASAVATTQALKDSLDPATGAITKYTRAWIAKTVAENDWVSGSAKDIGVTKKEIVDAIIAGGAQLDALNAKFTGQNNIVNFVNGSGIRAGNATDKINEMVNGLKNSKTQLDEQAKSAGDSADSTSSAATAYQKAADQAATLESNLKSLIDTINAANGVGQDAVSSNAAYQEALAGIGAEVQRQQSAYEEANGTLDGYVFSIDESTAAGSANADMFADLASKSQKAADAQFALDGNVNNYKATLEAGRQTMYDQILALTGSADAAQALTDKIYAIPSAAQFQVIADTNEAQRRLDAINASLDAFRSSSMNLTAYVREVGGNENGGLYAGGVKAFENGGFPSGIYPGRPGGIHKFAEGNLPWEAYISPKPGQENRNRAIATEALSRLGGPSPWSSPKASQISGRGAGGSSMSVMNLQVTVSVNAGAIASPQQLPKIITDAVRSGIKNGDIPKGWND